MLFKLLVEHISGEYHVNILLNGIPVDDCPFITKVYDVKQIKVKDIPKGIIGKPVTFVGKFRIMFIYLLIFCLFFIYFIYKDFCF